MLAGVEQDLYLLRDGMYVDENIHVTESWGLSNTGDLKEINIYQIPDVELIWDNKGMNGFPPVSIWRAKQINGYFNPGDIAVYGHSSPGVGFLLKGYKCSLLTLTLGSGQCGRSSLFFASF